MTLYWSRRAWLTRHAALLGGLSPRWRKRLPMRQPPGRGRPAGAVVPTDDLALAPLQALALRAVDAARAAGATYADARVTREARRGYAFHGQFLGRWAESVAVGVGVRVLIDGYWGFAASPFLAPDEVVRLARAAVAQARADAQANAAGPSRPVELAPCPRVTGTWTTPVAIDPFAMPLEEKLEAIRTWVDTAQRAGSPISTFAESEIHFVGQKQVLATSEGSLVTQTLYESGGTLLCEVDSAATQGVYGRVAGIDDAGEGWERFLNAQIPEQFATMQDKIVAQAELARSARPCEGGRYTLVCDGATMAALLEHTLGVATQLDRALGSEANATGTSFLDDPLAMVGHFPVASPLVTVLANRTAPTQLATVQWDDEGVVPAPFPLVQAGVLVDFQTSREQAAWLAPYYQAHGQPVRSHGCAAAADAHGIAVQMMPNLALAPSAAAIGVEELVADVSAGIWIEGGVVVESDSQACTGLLLVADAMRSQMRQITHGTLGRALHGGALQFDTLDLWHQIRAIGGVQSVGGTAFSGYGTVNQGLVKGEPAQQTSHSVCAAAATIPNQPVINLRRTA